MFAMAIDEYSFMCNLVVSDEDGDSVQEFPRIYSSNGARIMQLKKIY